MGLSTKQVSGDQGIVENWSQTNLLQYSDAAELAKSQPIRQSSEPLKCPRCGSTNTKFCYYNNYNKSQPRHFCKGCKRHWTKGGTLRNVPVGGVRKNKRPKISDAAATTTSSLPTSAANTANNHKSMSNILYQALIRNSPTILHETNATMNSTGDLNYISAPQNAPNSTDLIQFSTLSNTSLIYPTSHQSFDNHYIGNLDSLEESTITTVNINPSSSSELWPGPDTSSTLDLPNYWNWNDHIDVLSSADLNISWDDQDEAEIKLNPKD